MNVRELSDTALVHLFRQGDEKAFSVLYNRYQKKIESTIVYYVRDRQVSEDLLQEAYIKIITSIKADRYTEEGKFLPWALRIVHNHCMDYLRKQNRTPYISALSGEGREVVFPVSETKMMREQTAAYLHALMNKLSPEQKEVVHYKYFDDLSFKEIAALTNTGINTSLGRMRYALSHLKAMACPASVNP